MNGITNAQQQGGGGGGSAASYKAIKSTLTPSDWQEVAKQPYFVGSNVPIVRQNLAQSGFTPVKNTYYLHTGNTNENYTKGVIYKCVETTDTSNPLQLFEVISRYELGTLLEEGVLPYISKRKFISQSSKNVSITGSSEPYLFTVVDNDLKSTLYIRSFVNLYPRDEATEQWLKDHMLSNIIDVDAGKFSFKVNTATLPTTFNLDYVILNVIN